MDASSDPYLPYDGGGDGIPLRELHKRGTGPPAERCGFQSLPGEALGSGGSRRCTEGAAPRSAARHGHCRLVAQSGAVAAAAGAYRGICPGLSGSRNALLVSASQAALRARRLDSSRGCSASVVLTVLSSYGTGACGGSSRCCLARKPISSKPVLAVRREILFCCLLFLTAHFERNAFPKCLAL